MLGLCTCRCTRQLAFGEAEIQRWSLHFFEVIRTLERRCKKSQRVQAKAERNFYAALQPRDSAPENFRAASLAQEQHSQWQEHESPTESPKTAAISVTFCDKK